MTVIRTPKAKYAVEGIVVKDGTVTILARASKGAKLQHLTRERVGRPRFDAAVAHWFAGQS